ncbi:MAG: hypothetical protein IT326_03570, partial [Anaerolineae bacterium]|nr:hypothetical protein [Anaerolineae bacterium]
RESPSLDIIRLLQERGAEVIYNDPYIPDLHHEGLPLNSVDLDAELFAEMDCVIVVTDHTVYDWQMLADHARIVIDTRNALKRIATPKATVIRL